MLSFRSNDMVLAMGAMRALQHGFLLQGKRYEEAQFDTYPAPSGFEPLRKALELLTPHWSGDTLVTNSATESLYLALSQVDGHKRIAVQVPCYFAVLRQAKALGLTVVPWEHIEELREKNFDAILLTSNFAPPYGVSLSPAQRLEICDIARTRNSLLIEDNPYDPLWFESAPRALSGWPNRTLRIGSLSKIVSPRLRLGFIRTPSHELFKALRSAKITLNLSTAEDLQAIACHALDARVFEETRREWAHRASVLHELLTNSGAQVVRPQGGSFLCLGVGGPPAREIPRLLELCRKEGLLLDGNEHYYPDGLMRPYVRLHIGAMSALNMPQGASILMQALNS